MTLLQEIVSVAVQNVQDMENIIKEPNRSGTIRSSHSNGNDPYKHFVSMTYQFTYNFIRLLIYFMVQLFLLMYSVIKAIKMLSLKTCPQGDILNILI